MSVKWCHLWPSYNHMWKGVTRYCCSSLIILYSAHEWNRFLCQSHDFCCVIAHTYKGIHFVHALKDDPICWWRFREKLQWTESCRIPGAYTIFMHTWRPHRWVTGWFQMTPSDYLKNNFWPCVFHKLSSEYCLEHGQPHQWKWLGLILLWSMPQLCWVMHVLQLYVTTSY